MAYGLRTPPQRSYDLKMVDGLKLILASFLAFSAVLADNGPVPVVIWHGMGMLP